MMPVGATAPRATLTDYVVGVLRAKTASGELQPGQHLREAEIATALGVSPHTARTHVERVRRKLGVARRTEVAARIADA